MATLPRIWVWRCAMTAAMRTPVGGLRSAAASGSPIPGSGLTLICPGAPLRCMKRGILRTGVWACRWPGTRHRRRNAAGRSGFAMIWAMCRADRPRCSRLLPSRLCKRQIETQGAGLRRRPMGCLWARVLWAAPIRRSPATTPLTGHGWATA